MRNFVDRIACMLVNCCKNSFPEFVTHTLYSVSAYPHLIIGQPPLGGSMVHHSSESGHQYTAWNLRQGIDISNCFVGQDTDKIIFYQILEDYLYISVFLVGIFIVVLEELFEEGPFYCDQNKPVVSYQFLDY